MIAARWHAAKDIRIDEVPIPEPNENQVQIEVKFTGICGSDLHEYNHGPQLIPFDKPYLLNGHQGTTTLGHEFSGIVVSVGENVKSVKKDDRVVVEPIFRNPDSPFITNGQYNLSEPLGFVGLTSNGAFAKYVVVEDYMVHKIPDDFTFEQGALVEPSAVAVYAVQQSGLSAGDTVFVSGAGPIGLLCVQAALAFGATKVFVSDMSDARLDMAKKVGATQVFKATEPDIPEKIKQFTGLGVDVYIDAAGVQASFSTGISALRNGGTAVLVALFGKPVTHDALDQALREITIKAIIGYRNVFPKTIELIHSGKMKVDKLITKKISLNNIVKDGFEALINDPSEVKILVDVNQ